MPTHEQGNPVQMPVMLYKALDAASALEALENSFV